MTDSEDEDEYDPDPKGSSDADDADDDRDGRDDSDAGDVSLDVGLDSDDEDDAKDAESLPDREEFSRYLTPFTATQQRLTGISTGQDIIDKYPSEDYDPLVVAIDVQDGFAAGRLQCKECKGMALYGEKSQAQRCATHRKPTDKDLRAYSVPIAMLKQEIYTLIDSLKSVDVAPEKKSRKSKDDSKLTAEKEKLRQFVLAAVDMRNYVVQYMIDIQNVSPDDSAQERFVTALNSYKSIISAAARLRATTNLPQDMIGTPNGVILKSFSAAVNKIQKLSRQVPMPLAMTEFVPKSVSES